MRYGYLTALSLILASAISFAYGSEPKRPSFLEVIEYALLHDNSLPLEEVQIDLHNGDWDVTVVGKKQGLFIIFPLEPKLEFAQPGFHYYKAQEEEGARRSYELAIYDNPTASGFVYAHTGADLSPFPQTLAETESRLADSRRMAAQKVIETFYQLRQQGFKVDVQQMKFQDYGGPLHYTTGDWKVQIHKSDGSLERDSLIRIVVGIEKIYVVEVTSKIPLTERTPWYGTDRFQPTSFFDSIQLFGHSAK